MFILVLPLRAQESQEAKSPRLQRKALKAVFTCFEVDMGKFTGGSGDILSVGGNLRVNYGINDRWGILLGIGRSASTSNFQTSLYTNFQLGLVRSLGSPLIRYEEGHTIGKDTVVKKVDSFTGGFRLEMLVSLYLFNSNLSVVPFNSLGTALHYDLPSTKDWYYTVGIGYEYLSNSRRNLNAMKLLAGVMF